MMTQNERAEEFRRLHVKGQPLVLFNVWDAGSAKAVAESGAKAIATGSWSVAAAFGYADGEQLPLNDALANIERIVKAVELPVSLDFESGYARAAAELRDNVRLALETGIVGINFEDSISEGVELYSIDEQAMRIAAVREAAQAAGVDMFINARVDVFLMGPTGGHPELMPEANARAKAYASAGASGIFVPGLSDHELIGALCESTPLPVNVMKTAVTPSNAALADLGVARISYGPGPYREMIARLKAAAENAFAAGPAN